MSLLYPELFAIVENFFFNKNTNENFHEFLYIYKGSFAGKEFISNQTTSDSEELFWLPKSKIKILKPGCLSKLVNPELVNPEKKRYNSPIIHLINKD